MEIRLLGPVELLTERGPVPIGSAKQRALLAFMALNPQRLLTYDVLIDGLWGDEPPDATVEALRFHVSRLRGIPAAASKSCAWPPPRTTSPPRSRTGTGASAVDPWTHRVTVGSSGRRKAPAALCDRRLSRRAGGV